MIHFESVELIEIEMEMRVSMTTGHGTIGTRRLLLLKGTTPNGVVWSECGALMAPTYHYETVDTAWLALSQWILPHVVGRYFDSVEAIRLEMEAGIVGHYFAKSAVEMAAWAAEALGAKQSIATLLGGTFRSVPCGGTIGIRDDAAMVAEAVQLVANGYRRIKVKIIPGHDVGVIRKIRDVVPNDIQLFADANGSYSTESDAAVLAVCESGVQLLEQPFKKSDFLRHSVIQKISRIPVCLDESIQTIADLETAAALGACRSISIKPGRVGGIGPTVSIHRRALELGIVPWLGGMFETGIGRSYNLALASVVQSDCIGDISPAGRYWIDDLIDVPHAIGVDGGLKINYAGIEAGFNVDEVLVSKMQVRKQKIANKIPMNYSR